METLHSTDSKARLHILCTKAHEALTVLRDLQKAESECTARVADMFKYHEELVQCLTQLGEAPTNARIVDQIVAAAHMLFVSVTEFLACHNKVSTAFNAVVYDLNSYIKLSRSLLIEKSANLARVDDLTARLAFFMDGARRTADGGGMADLSKCLKKLSKHAAAEDKRAFVRLEAHSVGQAIQEYLAGFQTFDISLFRARTDLETHATTLFPALVKAVNAELNDGDRVFYT